MELIERIRTQAKNKFRRIALPEGTEPRVQKAALFLKQNGLAEPVLLGNESDIDRVASENGINLDGIEKIDPQQAKAAIEYAGLYYELRKHKGITREEAAHIVKNELYFGAFLVRTGEAAGAVAGSVNTTGDVMRAAIQVVGMAEGLKAVSSSFLMVMPDGRIFTFGDCAVIPNPDPGQLASIAISSATTHKSLVGTEPAVALLSFSTKGSARHDDVEKVTLALDEVKKLQPGLNIDGELQFDAALIESIGKKKAPGSPVAGKANVFIFPDLDAGNIGYKILQRLAGAEAVGPVVQGLAHPYNDLSRGCSVEDIINVACICSVLS